MKFLLVFIILFVFIITNKFFLFNEEFLILLSFGSFCFVIYEKLGSVLNTRFEEKTLFIKNSLLTSIHLISIKLNESKRINKQFIKLKLHFSLLKKYYLKFSIDFLTNFAMYLNVKEKNYFLNKLNYLKQIEKEYSKLILLLLIKKIKIISVLIKFYGVDLKIQRFRTLNLINKLILLKKI
uniref:ATP synthase F1 subunit 4 n=1 Tax=Pterosiphonia complanata TaxID=884089 RepID=UPI0022FD3A0C|nr:ATP synthase F1 subunit 4 [Pterosiphonia complanata]WAX04092.1 ATP synthase F1 subunit 4 [Pterosiphonia complanata]